MEESDKRKKILHRTLAGVGVVLIFILIFFSLGPAVFGQSHDRDVDADSQKYALLFAKAMGTVSKYYVDEVDKQKLFDGAMKGMFEALKDPYSVYLSDSDMVGFNDLTSGEFGGVGLYINKFDPSAAEKSVNPKDKYVEVVAPIEDTPAYKAGILAGDCIIKIEGKPVDKMSMDNVLAVLRGKPDTKVTLTILRGDSTTMDFTLNRAIIQVPSVKSTFIEPDIAYIRITQFNAHTPEGFHNAVMDFQKKGYKKLVVDLRNNPGGLLEAVTKIADEFFKDGVIVSTKSRIPGESAVYSADSDQTIPDSIPVVVLIDKGSASASEILSGALKDRKRGFLLGDTTYGKGSVQQIIPFDKTGFKLTIAKYYTPSGVNIDKVGIKPHEVFKDKELTDNQLKALKDIVQNKEIEKFVKTKPSDSAIEKFAIDESKKTSLELRLIKRLIRQEKDLQENKPSAVIDLDYDIQLQEAIRILNKGPLLIP